MLIVLMESRFLWSAGLSVLVCILLAILAARAYDVEESKKKTVSIDRLTSSANAVITAAGFTIPLISALAAYAYLQLSQSPRDLAFLVAAMATMTLSILIGLSTVGGMASLGNGGAALEIHRNKHRSIPFQLVLQLGLFVASIVLVALYVLFGLRQQPQARNDNAHNGPSIVRRHLNVGETMDAIVTAWGSADRQDVAGDVATLTYRTQTSMFEIRVERGRAVKIVETAH